MTCSWQNYPFRLPFFRNSAIRVRRNVWSKAAVFSVSVTMTTGGLLQYTFARAIYCHFAENFTPV